MVDNGKPPVLIVVQLPGGNDFMNTVVPYGDGQYYDHRPTVHVEEDRVLPIDDEIGINADASPIKELYDLGNVAIVQGVGYPNTSRSHFRSTYIWYTCEPDKVSTVGWLGKAVRDIDPGKENIVTGVNFGKGLPVAFAAPGVPITSVSDLTNLGVMTSLPEATERDGILERFKEMYAPGVGTGPVMDYLTETGLGLLKGEDILKSAPDSYESGVEYASDPFSRSLREVAQVHLADLGTRIFYTSHAGNYDTHSNQAPVHENALKELSRAIMDFFQDLEAHEAADNVLMLVWTEFGRRVQDNGSGTDHGAGGGAFLIGSKVNGGLYGQYPSLKPGDLSEGEDLAHTYDFRGLYGTILEQWMDLEASPIVGGNFEQLPVFE